MMSRVLICLLALAVIFPLCMSVNETVQVYAPFRLAVKWKTMTPAGELEKYSRV